MMGVKGTPMINFNNILTSHINRFWGREDGAVTVDWVVLTAAVVGMAMIIVNILQPALFDNGGSAIASYVAEAAQR
jgi:hypothetical protein